MDCCKPRFYSVLLNQLFLALYVTDYSYLNSILCTLLYNIVPYWLMSVSSIYQDHLALWNVCGPISSYVLGVSSVFFYTCFKHSTYPSFQCFYRCSWKCVHYMKLLSGEVFHIWQMLLQFCSPLLMCRWCFAHGFYNVASNDL